MSKRKQATIAVKSDARGENWAFEKAQAMHAQNAERIDRAEAQRSQRRAARAERKQRNAA